MPDPEYLQAFKGQVHHASICDIYADDYDHPRGDRLIACDRYSPESTSVRNDVSYTIHSTLP
jgi:hypothetical protein